MSLQRDLREFIALLNSHGVDYLVVGGHAVAFHGYPRFTGDIDFFFRPSPQNVARLLTVLADFGFEPESRLGEDLLRPGTVVQLGLPPNRIDLLGGISGVEFEEAWTGRVAAALDGLPVAFPALDVLLRNKEASGRERDAADARQLRAVVARGPRRGRQG